MKKTAVLIIMAILLSLCSCAPVYDPRTELIGAYGEEQENTEALPKYDLSLLYYPDMDTNPITTDCYANSELLKLVYSPAVRVDDKLDPVCVLAESCDISGLTITVRLKSGLLFSDGTPVTAKDAAASFAAARASDSSPYRRQAELFSSCYAADSLTLVCVLSEPQLCPEALLDVPIMKNGKDAAGCGPYVFSERNGDTVLAANETYFDAPSVKMITLLETKRDDAVTDLFSSGELDLLSLPGGESMSLTSLRDYKIISYPSNSFIYLDINVQSEPLSSAQARRAVSVCVDRKAIASRSFVDLADATEYPFNPHWSALEGSDCAPEYSAEQKAEAAALISGNKLKFIYPSDSDIKTAVAQSAAENLNAAGADIDLVGLDDEAFESAVKSKSYDICLCETVISRTLDPTFIYGTGGSLNLSGFEDGELDEAFLSLKNGSLKINGYLTVFSLKTPIVPLLFRRGVMYCDNAASGFTAQSPWNSLGDFCKVTID